MLLCTKFPVTSNGGISEARGAKQRCDETTLLAKEIREWRCGTGSRARRNVRVSGRGVRVGEKLERRRGSSEDRGGKAGRGENVKRQSRRQTSTFRKLGGGRPPSPAAGPPSRHI
ncbi:uncharacterized protein LOC114577681 isoform X8 [Apis cerana]|uniref:uncharacterized protein LOC114577681 isoform X8 n=1 Tax=Apis cerana TaxID=7461 RepID=UPI002B2256C3|nr:uncharacterized protein LOC114577681 isoform X8 [Apis cerana]